MKFEMVDEGGVGVQLSRDDALRLLTDGWPSEEIHLSWIIPAYNEENRIERTVREVVAYLDGLGISYEIIVVDNNSTDRTRNLTLRLAEEFACVRYVGEERRGKGAAVKRGMRAARGAIRVFADADNSTSPEHFDRMVPYFARGYPVVVSSRLAADAPGATLAVRESLVRELAGRVGNLLIRAIGVGHIRDTQNGFKALTKEASERIFGQLSTDGFAFDIELLALANLYGYPVGIIPAIWRHNSDSRVTPAAYFQVLRDVFLIRWKLLRGRYAASEKFAEGRTADPLTFGSG